MMASKAERVLDFIYDTEGMTTEEIRQELQESGVDVDAFEKRIGALLIEHGIEPVEIQNTTKTPKRWQDLKPGMKVRHRGDRREAVLGKRSPIAYAYEATLTTPTSIKLIGDQIVITDKKIELGEWEIVEGAG